MGNERCNCFIVSKLKMSAFLSLSNDCIKISNALSIIEFKCLLCFASCTSKGDESLSSSVCKKGNSSFGLIQAKSGKICFTCEFSYCNIVSPNNLNLSEVV